MIALEVDHRWVRCSVALRQLSGQTPKSWLHHYRIKVAARKLAEEPHTTVSHVIESCGYHSRSLFYRMFQRLWDVPPIK